jgi:hypothetical protein
LAWDFIASQQQQDNEACTEEGFIEETFTDPAEDNILTAGLFENNTVSATSVPTSVEQLCILPGDDYYGLLG